MPTKAATQAPTAKQIARGSDIQNTYKVQSPLPGDILADLVDAFEFYDKE